MTPTTDLDRCICWCPTCGSTGTPDPDWAEQHHATTGHTTHRRSWTVQTWTKENP